MSHLCFSEVVTSYDTFFNSLYGNSNYERWKLLKQQLNIVSEKLFVSWMLDAAECQYENQCTTSVSANNGNPNHWDTIKDEHDIDTQEYVKEETNINNEVTRGEGGENDGSLEYGDMDADGDDSIFNNSDGLLEEEEVNQKIDGLDGYIGYGDQLDASSLLHATSGEEKCKVCKAMFPDKSKLISHLKDMHRSVVQCEICLKIYQSRTSMLRHVNTVHTKPAEHKCLHCAEVFVMRSERLEHEQQVHTEKTMCFECDTCSKKFTTKRAMQQHIKDIHINVKTRPCQFCGLSFTRLSTLRRHEAVVHLGIKEYKCQVSRCIRKFGSKCERDLHQQRSHMKHGYDMGDNEQSGMQQGGDYMEDSVPNNVELVDSVIDLDA